MASLSSITILLLFSVFLLLGIVFASDKVSKVPKELKGPKEPKGPKGKDNWIEDLSKETPKVPDFNYQEVEQWGSKHPTFAVCSSGKRQSPVDINTYEIVVNKKLEPLNRKYSIKNATLSTEGSHIEVLFTGKGGLTINGKTYDLAQMHFHTPSEHRLNGIQYAAELHQVHKAADGTRAVVGVLFKHGPPSPFISMLMPQLRELAKTPCKGHEHSTAIPKFQTSFLRKWPRDYYRYEGSLTTPPCDENVIWSVLTEAKTISKDQVIALKMPLCEEDKVNARPAQPLNGRKVQKYMGE